MDLTSGLFRVYLPGGIEVFDLVIKASLDTIKAILVSLFRGGNVSLYRRPSGHTINFSASIKRSAILRLSAISLAGVKRVSRCRIFICISSAGPSAEAASTIAA